MPVEIEIGRPQLVINQGDTILVTDDDGQIPWPSDKGLYFFDTRLISSWNIFANGVPFELLNSGAITHYAARVYLTNPVIETEQGDIPEHTLSLVLSRSLDGGVHEDIDITNHGINAVRFNLEIAAPGESMARSPMRKTNSASALKADNGSRPRMADCDIRATLDEHWAASGANDFAPEHQTPLEPPCHEGIRDYD